MRTLSLTSAKLMRGKAVVWAKATQFQLDQEDGMLRVTVARLPTEEGTSTSVSTVAPLRSKAAIAFPAILENVTASGASFSWVTALAAIFPGVTAPSASLEVMTAPSAILENVTASGASFGWVTALFAILAVVTAPSAMPDTHEKPS